MKIDWNLFVQDLFNFAVNFAFALVTLAIVLTILWII